MYNPSIYIYFRRLYEPNLDMIEYGEYRGPYGGIIFITLTMTDHPKIEVVSALGSKCILFS